MDEFRDPIVNPYLLEHFKGSMGRLNTFGFFIEQAKDVMKEDGELGFIIPNTFLTQGYYEDLRKRVLEETAVQKIALLHGQVFEDAVVENVVLIARKLKSGLPAHRGEFELALLGSNGQTERTANYRQTDVAKNFKSAFFTIFDKEIVKLQHKLESSHATFGQTTNINQAIALKYDRAAALEQSRKTKEHKPILDGRDIGRYLTRKARNYFKFDVEKIHSCKREDIFLAPEKILFRRVGERIIATLDSEQNYALNTLVVMTPGPECAWPLRALLGILNSSVANFYYTFFLKSSKEVFSEIQARQIAQVPLPKINWEDYRELKKLNELTKLVDELLRTEARLASGDAGQRELRRQIALLDEDVDKIVFDLYHLPESERETIVTSLKARQDAHKDSATSETPSLFE